MDLYSAIVYSACLALTVAYVGPLIWAGIGFRKLFPGAGAEPLTPSSGSAGFVSVVIAARNEEDQIRQCLESIVKSDYPRDKFEILVVDDDSIDHTQQIARAYAAESGTEHIIQVLSSPAPPETGQKKAALAHGIARAKGEILLLTDADCRVPANWISSMTHSFGDRTGFVAGPVQFSLEPNVRSRIFALEFMGLVALAAGSIRQGRPFSCSGASVAFRRSAYLEAGGYDGLEHLSSGDDEMLMHRISSLDTWQVDYCRVPSAVVQTAAPSSLRSFVRQRRRWASKSIHYEKKTLIAGVAAGLLFIGALIAVFVAGFFNPTYWVVLSGMLLAKIAAETSLLFSSSRVFKRPNLLKYHIMVQPFHIIYVAWSGLTGIFGQFEWKGRRLSR